MKRDNKTGRFLPIGKEAKPKLKFKDKFVSFRWLSKCKAIKKHGISR